MNEQQTERMLTLLGEIAGGLDVLREIAGSLNRLASTGEDPDDAPDLERPIGDYRTFDWGTIGAYVHDADDDGPTIVEWHGHMFKRRSPENQFGAVVFFSRWIGRNEQGQNQYVRLITFKPMAEVQPVSRKAERELKQAPAPTPRPAVAPVTAPQAAPTAVTPQAAPTAVTTVTPSPDAATASANTADVIAGLDGTVRATQPPLPIADQPTAQPTAQPKARPANPPSGPAYPRWLELSERLAHSHKRYQNRDGDPDRLTILYVAAALGYPKITADNLEQVIEALATHAKEA